MMSVAAACLVFLAVILLIASVYVGIAYVLAQIILGVIE